MTLAISLAAALVGHSATAGLAIPGRRHPAVQALLGVALAQGAGARLGCAGPNCARVCASGW